MQVGTKFMWDSDLFYVLEGPDEFDDFWCLPIKYLGKITVDRCRELAKTNEDPRLDRRREEIVDQGIVDE